jgi:hypothetical protein
VATESGGAVDITGAELRFAAKFANSNYLFINKSSTASGDEIEIINASLGTAILYLDPADTIKLPPRVVNLTYDLQLTELSGSVTTLVSGTLVVDPDVAA